MHRQTFKTTLSEGGGEGKHFCDYDCVSIPGKEEMSPRFWFVSTSFVRGCRSMKTILITSARGYALGCEEWRAYLGLCLHCSVRPERWQAAQWCTLDWLCVMMCDTPSKVLTVLT